MRLHVIAISFFLCTMPLLALPDESASHMTTRKRMTKFFKKSGGKALIGTTVFLVGGTLIWRWRLRAIPQDDPIQMEELSMSESHVQSDSIQCLCKQFFTCDIEVVINREGEKPIVKLIVPEEIFGDDLLKKYIDHGEDYRSQLYGMMVPDRDKKVEFVIYSQKGYELSIIDHAFLEGYN